VFISDPLDHRYGKTFVFSALEPLLIEKVGNLRIGAALGQFSDPGDNVIPIANLIRIVRWYFNRDIFYCERRSEDAVFWAI
jgi:hypothetical protein